MEVLSQKEVNQLLCAIEAGDSEEFVEALDSFERYLTGNTSGQVLAKAWSFFGFIYSHGARNNYEKADYWFTKAVDWFTKSAEQGNAEAQYNLGLMYANGQGVLRDKAKAAEWLKKAAAQGYEKAKDFVP